MDHLADLVFTPTEQSAPALSRGDRLVIKIGSALLTANGSGLDRKAITEWVAQIARLHAAGIRVVLVSSGAVAEGVKRLGWSKRPDELCQLQAAAAVGQMGLIQHYEQAFQQHQLHTAQVLLTHDDLSDRKRYLNARSTLTTLLELNVVPVVNENDTVVTDEIRFGDNDTLAGLVANLIEAKALLILTDQAGLYESDPREQPAARRVVSSYAADKRLDQMAGGSGLLGRGGMQTKLRAARLAARSGAFTYIAHGSADDAVGAVLNGCSGGTLLKADREPMAARKLWLAAHLHCAGSVTLDGGAVTGITEKGRSLLAVGVVSVQGDFRRGDLVACLNSRGIEVARGLVNYSAVESRLIVGEPSHRITEILGYLDEEELIHRDNMVLS
ncbi:MAG: glutamate 5-kinase [Immundisolibacteraceae bacterium]|nr:glutamate 5-kinase [Immundisolibacteraceae bacterium]